MYIYVTVNVCKIESLITNWNEKSSEVYNQILLMEKKHRNLYYSKILFLFILLNKENQFIID